MLTGWNQPQDDISQYMHAVKVHIINRFLLQLPFLKQICSKCLAITLQEVQRVQELYYYLVSPYYEWKRSRKIFILTGNMYFLRNGADGWTISEKGMRPGNFGGFESFPYLVLDLWAEIPWKIRFFDKTTTLKTVSRIWSGMSILKNSLPFNAELTDKEFCTIGILPNLLTFPEMV